MTGRARAVVLFLDRCILWVSRHWLASLNFLVGVYVGLPLIAPALLATGLSEPARIIYTLYSLACHQYPERSFFLFGQQLAYCQRDTTLYSTTFLLGLAFAVTGRRWRPLAWRAAVLLVLPMAVDGTLQLFGLYESTWWLRTGTGMLAATGAVGFLYPRFNASFAETGALAERQLERARLRDEGQL